MPNNTEHEREEQRKREEQQQRQQQERDRQQREQEAGPGGVLPQPKPGDKVANPAHPEAPTEVPPDYPNAADVFGEGAPGAPTAYPKVKFHPIYGGVRVSDASEEGLLQPPYAWFDSAELADMARTYTEAEQVRTHNQLRKLKELEDAGLPVVSSSVQAEEAVRRGMAEPL